MKIVNFTKVCTSHIRETVSLTRPPAVLPLCSIYSRLHLHRNQNRGIPIPSNERVLATSTPRILQISPFTQEILMCQDFCEFTGDGAVHVFHDAEISGKEDVEVALLDLRKALAASSLAW